MDRKGLTGSSSLVQSLSRDVGEEEEGTREPEMGWRGGGAGSGRAEEWDYQPEDGADLLIHWTTLIIISNEKYSLPLLRAVSLSVME